MRERRAAPRFANRNGIGYVAAMRLRDSSGRPSDSLTITIVSMLAFVVLAYLTAFGLTGEHGPSMVAALGASFGASLPLYYKRRAARDAAQGVAE